MPIEDYNSSASLNTLLGTIAVGPGMARADVNNAIQQLMGDIGGYKGSITGVDYITDLADIATDGTDQDANIIAALIANYSVGQRKTVVIPNGVRWNPQNVLADATVKTLDRLVIFDLAGYNAATSAGENSKQIGVFSIDSDATEDTQFGHVSNHHPTLLVSNTGLAGTESGNIGRASILFARGYFTDGNQSFKGALIQQYRRSFLDNTIWEHVWSSLAPWEVLAIGADYTQWTASTAYVVGDYVVTEAGAILECTVSGTSGSTAPAPAVLGTATDGTATWQWIDAADRQVFSFDQQGRLKTNGATEIADLAAFKQAVTDTTTTAIMRLSATGNSKTVRIVGEPTNSGGSTVGSAFLLWNTDGALEVLDSAATRMSSYEGINKGFKVEMLRGAWATAADGDTTPSVQNKHTLYLSNTGATSITTLDDPQDGQVVELIATNGNTTLVHSSSLTLTGSTNIAMTAYSSVTLRRVPSSISSRWVEVARSIK